MTAEAADRRGQIESVAALADPVRRSLYDLVVSKEPEDLSRDQAAEALDMRRGLVAFHLDKLVQAGLLEARYRRPSGVGGPGAGRPTKYYRRSPLQVDVSLPERRYDLMGGFLAGAIAQGGRKAARPARSAAHDFGSGLGELARSRSGAGASDERLLRQAMAVLAEHGFEPVRTARSTIILRNCPFHLLATSFTDTVCDVNLALHEGLAAGLGLDSLQPVREQSTDRCCVVYRLA